MRDKHPQYRQGFRDGMLVAFWVLLIAGELIHFARDAGFVRAAVQALITVGGL